MKAVERIAGITVIPKQAKCSSIESIFKTAFVEEKTKVYDCIWCVFDCDTISKTTPYEKLEKLKRQAEKKNIRITDSLPAFEIWFLLHYVIPKKYYIDQDALIKELKTYLPEYKKSMHSLYSNLKSTARNSIGT
ncbi:MAG: RloB family protein [Treponema sp.]